MGINEVTGMVLGLITIISTVIGSVVALGKALKKYIDHSIKEATKIPIQRIHDLVELLNVKTDINIKYHKQETDNGYGKFYDIEMDRYLSELEVRKAIENKRPVE